MISATESRDEINSYLYKTPAPPVSRKQSQITKLKAKLAQKDDYIGKLTEENQALKNEYGLLRGSLFLLMQRQSQHCLAVLIFSTQKAIYNFYNDFNEFYNDFNENKIYLHLHYNNDIIRQIKLNIC